MSPWLWRVFGATAIIAAAVLAVPVACGGPAEVCDPNSGACSRDEQVGKVGQACFPGDLCDPGLTCVARAIASDAGSLGTDGGQCFCLSDVCTPRVEDAGAEGPGQ
jgi:hypothetical protein